MAFTCADWDKSKEEPQNANLWEQDWDDDDMGDDFAVRLKQELAKQQWCALYICTNQSSTYHQLWSATQFPTPFSHFSDAASIPEVIQRWSAAGNTLQLLVAMHCAVPQSKLHRHLHSIQQVHSWISGPLMLWVSVAYRMYCNIT